MVYHFIDTYGCNLQGPIPEQEVVMEKEVLRSRPIHHWKAMAL